MAISHLCYFSSLFPCVPPHHSMVLLLHNPPTSTSSHLLSVISLSPPKSNLIRPSSASMSASSPRPFLQFPHLSASHRSLMLSVVSSIETRLAPHLLPSSLPPDVRYFESATGTSNGALDIQTGREGSMVDFILGSWIHCALPSGSSLDITTLFACLNSTTDAPHFVLELIQNSPTSLILIIDLLPRKDLILHPLYLQTFYENTQLEKERQKLESLPETKPYFSSSLYVRGVWSPTGIVIRIECGSGQGARSMEEVVRDDVNVVAEEVVRIWLDVCESGSEVGEKEREDFVRRDGLLKRKAVEIDLVANLPRLFGEETAGRIVKAIQEVFRV